MFYLKTQYQIQSHLDFFSVFHARSFIFLHFTFRFMIHFQFTFCIRFQVCVKIYFISICSFLYIDPMHILLDLYLTTSFFGTIVKDNVSLISESSCSLLVYGKAIKFCILTWYPATLLYKFIISRRFLYIPSGFLHANNIIRE